jgi:LL-diaminopimelate aminotransferase
MFAVDKAERLKLLPPYLFKELDRLRGEARAKGVDVIDLGVGDPDQPTPGHIIDRLCRAAADPANHQYPSYSGMNDFRGAAADWHQRRHGLSLDPGKEIITLIGSKEGLAHLPLALINPGDLALIPEPAYPVYYSGVVFAGGRCEFMSLKPENGFLPDLDAIDPKTADEAKLMFVNYPNNPTGATADEAFYAKLAEFAARHHIIVVSDAAYAEMTYDGYTAPSFLSAPGAREVGVEIWSLSKTYNMTGWRLAWAAGRPEVIEALGAVKSNVDSGVFQAVQWAGIEALAGDQSVLEDLKAMYRRRRDVLIEGLAKAGLQVRPPKATFYLWARVPDGWTSAGFAARLLTEQGIVATPGNGFGPSGEGYIRFALTRDEDRLREAAQRIQNLE